MAPTEKPFIPPGDALLPAYAHHYAHHYTIIARCSRGHEREIYARPIQRILGAGVAIRRVRACLRCHKCQARRPVIEVSRMPR
jgi:hypothetical protein